MEWLQWLSGKETVLRVHEPLTISDHRHSWPLLKLAQMPEHEWPAAPWDVRVGLDLHQTLCLPAVEALTKKDYPAYWQGCFQQAFPDEQWVVSPTSVETRTSVLVTAFPQRLNEALQPFQSVMRWCRPVWAPVLEDREKLLSVKQRASLMAWVYWENSKVLWLQRHRNLAIGWKKSVIRAAPLVVAEREEWLRAMLAREYANYEGTTVPPGVLVVEGSCEPMEAIPFACTEEMLNGWVVFRPSVKEVKVS